MVVDDVEVLFRAAIFENGGQGRRAFMLRVYVFRLMGVIPPCPPPPFDPLRTTHLY